VDIFDTNTHSVHWEDRRKEVIAGYPGQTIKKDDLVSTAPIEIGDDVWIGKGASILKGCSIGARSIVGTRSVVTNSCIPDSLLVGNPAQIKQKYNRPS
jgi:acetyltransferase-like isoleucine patch superfamily enzyme